MTAKWCKHLVTDVVICVVSFISSSEVAYCSAPALSGVLGIIYHKFKIGLCLVFMRLIFIRNFLIARLELLDKFCK